MPEDLKKLKSNLNYKLIASKINFSYKRYKKKYIYYYYVWLETELNAVNHVDIDKRSPNFNLDHIIPISLGFQYNIDPKIIGSISNIRFVSRSENFKKNSLKTVLVINKLREFKINLDKLEKVNSLGAEVEKAVKEKSQKIINKGVIKIGKSISDYPNGGDW